MADSTGENKPPVKDAGGKDIPINEIIANLVKDLHDPPGSVVLSGFIGPSNREGVVRVYSDLNLRSFCEVRGTDILHVHEVEPNHPETASHIVIKASANVAWVQTVEASFLQGAIAAAHPIRSGTPHDLPAGEQAQWGDAGAVTGLRSAPYHRDVPFHRLRGGAPGEADLRPCPSYAQGLVALRPGHSPVRRRGEI